MRPRDFLVLDSLLSNEQREIRDTVRQFVRDRVLPYVGEWFEAALDYSLARTQFGWPIASFQLQQQKLARMALEVNRAGLVALHLVASRSSGS